MGSFNKKKAGENHEHQFVCIKKNVKFGKAFKATLYRAENVLTVSVRVSDLQ